ncbi:sulfatase [Cellulophaga sp. F20128]|uniref:sulfatase family protein n=1 Tax=Cellulophaga sp. F20128 TaxID=2926413 RepID=UPI001FF3FAAC|nr:sulfatase [Cellulophaga sp. F20128]MCK0157298.1 sulfatase [Cellulophaga sp. F20128]
MTITIKGLLGFTLLFVVQFLTGQSEATNIRPNIIYLMADDQNTLSVGCYGNSEVLTPHMDKLGNDGLIFDKHYNTTSICMASRASVMTGMYEYKTGTNFNHGNMKPEVWLKSYPVLLKEAGYISAFAGKFGFEVEGKGLCEDDFDFWGGAPGQSSYKTAANKSMQKYAEKYPHSTLSYGAFGQDVIAASVKLNKPFCLSISFKAPHKPATPDPKFDSIYQGKTFTKPGNFGREYAKHLSEQSKSGRQYPRFTEWHYDTDYDGEMQKYYQQIYAIDVAIGMIRDELEKMGISDNTVIIYTSDNGYINGSHGYGSKVLPMEESSRVPLLIYDPRSKTSGKKLRTNALTGNIDFAPTILELAGLPIPENMDGKSLVPILKNPKKDIRNQMAFINVYGPIATHSLSCLTKQWKYTYWWYGKGMEPVEELFDLKNDPLELKNCATDANYSSELAIMRTKYAKELALWKKESVPYNDYERYGVLFDKTISWNKKENLAEGNKPSKDK